MSKKQREHKLAIASRSLKMFFSFIVTVGILVGLIFIYNPKPFTAWYIVLYSAIGFLFLLLIFYYIHSYYHRIFYENGNEICFEKKFFSTTKTILPYEKINSIKTSQTLIEKIFGIKTLSLDSGSVANSFLNEITITVNKNYCDVLEEYINNRVKLAKENLPCEEQLPLLEDNRKTSSNEVKGESYVLTMRGIFAASLMQATYYILSLVLIPIIYAFIGKYFYIGVGLAIATVSGVFLSLIIGFLQYLFRYYNFTLWQDDENIRIKCGMINKKSYILPKSKVNAICIRQSSMQRFFKYYSLEVFVVGYGSELDGFKKCFLFPSANKRLAQTIIQEYTPNFVEDINLVSSPKKTLRYFMTIPLVTMFVLSCVVASFVVFSALAFSEIIFALSAVFILFFVVLTQRILASKLSGIGTNDDLLKIQRGGFSKETIICNLSRVQAISKRTTCFRKKKGVASYKFYIVANAEDTVFDVPFLSEKEVDKFNLINY